MDELGTKREMWRMAAEEAVEVADLRRREVAAHERMAAAQEQIAKTFAEMADALAALTGIIDELSARIKS